MEEQLTQIERIADMVIDYIVQYAFQILGAIVVLVVGMLVARWVAGMVIRLCTKANMDVTLTNFMGGVVKTLVMTFVLIAVISQFGISIAPIIAALGAILFGASFAIAGPLSNYGSGLVIILTRPFVVGNTISIKGVSGVVEEIKLAATILSTEDGEEITIPNKHIVGEVLTNSFGYRIVEGQVGISYADDPEKAVSAIREVVSGFAEIPGDPAPIIGIQEYGDSAVNIGMRYWVPTRDYFKTLYAVNMGVYKQLKAAGITIPFPQRDVHIRSGSNRLSGEDF